jgi:phytoene desaturase
MKIVVIGSGFGGLSAAIRLQAAGHNVTIIEKRDKPGGRAYVFEKEGFTYDAGPTIITAPWLIDDIFASAGKKTADYVEIIKIDPFYNIRFEDGTVFRYNGDRESILKQIRALRPEDEKGYKKFIVKTADTFKTGMALIDKPFLKFTDMLKAAPDMIRLRADKSVAGLVNGYIKDHRLRQVFSFHPLLVGGNPFKTTSIYTLIHTLEQEWGVWFAMGGTGALVKAFVKCFEELGGKIIYNAEASEITIDSATNRATGVRLASGDLLPADSVVSNGDYANTYLKLIRPEFRKKNNDRKIKSYKQSMSLFVLYFGTKKKYENIAHHEILMGPRYKELLDDIFIDYKLADDFSLYLHRPTATDPSLAPEGCDTWYVLSPVPNLKSGTDWKTMAPLYRDRIVQYLEKRYMPELSKYITAEHFIDPLYFQNTLNSYLGNAFAVEPLLMQSAWFRPHNRSQDIPNLYLVGAGTHPGAGLPGVMSSGKIAADLIGKA